MWTKSHLIFLVRIQSKRLIIKSCSSCTSILLYDKSKEDENMSLLILTLTYDTFKVSSSNKNTAVLEYLHLKWKELLV